MAEESKARRRQRHMNLGISIRVAPGERALLAAAAEDSSMTISSWIRQHALRAAAATPRPAGPFQPLAAPHLPGKLHHRISGRFAAAEFEAIVEHARACGLTGSDLIRQLVLGHEPMVRQSCVRAAIAAVHRAGHNLGQLLHLAGAGAALAPDLMRTVTELRGEIHALLDALLRADEASPLDPAK